MDKWTTRLRSVLIEIWPFIYEAINGAIFFIFNVIRGMIKIAMEQLK